MTTLLSVAVVATTVLFMASYYAGKSIWKIDASRLMAFVAAGTWAWLLFSGNPELNATWWWTTPAGIICAILLGICLAFSLVGNAVITIQAMVYGRKWALIGGEE